MPSSSQARMMRTAISPRLAIRTFENIWRRRTLASRSRFRAAECTLGCHSDKLVSLQSDPVPLLPDVRRTRPGADRRRALTAIPQPEGAPAFAAWHPAPLLSRLASLDFRWRYPLAVYLLTRIVYLVVAFVAHFVRTDAYGRHWGLGSMVSNWDGKWYLTTAVHFYPHYVDRFMQNTLGFFPLYPMLMRGTGQTLGVPYWISGLMISLVTGAAATVLVGRLARIWWGEGAARRAVLFFCVFPGSIVFSMVYTEGLLLMLVAGSMLAIE